MSKKFFPLIFSFLFFSTAYSACPLPTDIDFAGTFSALEACCTNLESTITDCCQNLQQDFAITWELIDNINPVIALSQLNQNFCSPTFITQADVGSTGAIITNPGVYKLSESISFAPAGSANAVTIDADNVLFDLQCFALTQTNAQANVNGIGVNAGLDNVMIQNGLITDFSNAGIAVADDVSALDITDVTLNNNIRGIQLEGDDQTPITCALLKNIDIKNSVTAVEWHRVENSKVKKLKALRLGQTAIDSVQSFTNSFFDVTIKNVNAADGSAYGFKLTDGGANLIQNAQIAGVSTRSTDSTQVAVGIEIGENEQMDKILNSQICNVQSGTSWAQAGNSFGIDMLYSFTAVSNNGLPSVAINSAINAVAWSPDGRYVVIGVNTGILVYEFDGETLMQVASDSSGQALALSWSPDGRYLAASVSNDLYVFEFTGTALGTPVIVSPAGNVNDVKFSHNGRYIAATSGNDDPDVNIYEFTGSVLNLVASTSVALAARSVGWSPDDSFLAIGTAGTNAPIDSELIVYQFTGTALNLIDTLISFSGNGAAIFSATWFPNGQYIAALSTNPADFSSSLLLVVSFNGAQLQIIDSVVNFYVNPRLVLSPDGKYVAVGSALNVGQELAIYEFTGSALSSSPIVFDTGGEQVRSLDWNSTGDFIAIENDEGLNGRLEIFSAYRFPSGHIIKDNLVSAINGPDIALTFMLDTPAISSGRGIQASSGANLISGNSAFDNDINYIFVAFERFQEFVQNINFRNEFPNKLSNVSTPPL